MVKFPVYAFEGQDLTIFSSHIIPYVLENQDILRDIYRCFDSEGYCVHLQIINTKQEQQIPQRREFCIDEFRKALLHTLSFYVPTISKDLSLNELQQRIFVILKDDIY